MEYECVFRNSIKLSKSAFSITPKRFNSIYVGSASGKFILSMVYPVMFVIAYVPIRCSLSIHRNE